MTKHDASEMLVTLPATCKASTQLGSESALDPSGAEDPHSPERAGSAVLSPILHVQPFPLDSGSLLGLRLCLSFFSVEKMDLNLIVT